MTPPIRPFHLLQRMDDILIVGGGTAGWLTAAYLARHLGKGPGAVRISLIESSEVGTVGVGEGTFPTIARTLAGLGVDEAEFMRESSASFKHGIRFVDWVREPCRHGPASGRRHYFHPFALPRLAVMDLLPYWLLGDAGPGVSLADAVTLQERVCDAGRAPKRASDAAFRGPVNYAYHLDASRFGTFLSKVAKRLGVRHLVGHVDSVELDAQGGIGGVLTREHGRITAGLYVDCTGFRAQLIGAALGVPLRGVSDVLFVDRALAVQVPHEDERAPIAACTIATAQEAGWTWDIALSQRRGIGYVYSSRHCDDAGAESVLREYVGRDLAFRQLRFQLGWRERHWVKNCVAVGLAGGFLEPLESTGILLIEAAACMIAELFQRAGDPEPAARQFNQRMSRRYERIVDFIKLHYHLSRRRDSAFWRDNADPVSAPESLLAHLEMWRHRPPGRFDLEMDHESFALANYQFVLYGMEFETRLDRSRYPHSAPARQEFARVWEAAGRAAAALPAHRELLDRINQAGFGFAEHHAPAAPVAMTR
jgi:tryptophan halogenase